LYHAQTIVESGARLVVGFAGNSIDLPDVATWANSLGIVVEHIPTDPRPIYGTMPMRRAYETWQWLRERDGIYGCVLFQDTLGLGLYALHAKRAGLAFSRTAMVVLVSDPTYLRDQHQIQLPANGDEALVTYALERLAVEMADRVLVASPCVLEWMLTSGHRIKPQQVRRYTAESVATRQNIRNLLVYGNLELKIKIDILINALNELPCAGPNYVQIFYLGNETIDAFTSNVLRANVVTTTIGLIQRVHDVVITDEQAAMRYASRINAHPLDLSVNTRRRARGRKSRVSTTACSVSYTRGFDAISRLTHAFCGANATGMYLMDAIGESILDANADEAKHHVQDSHSMHLSICVSTTPGRIQLLDLLLGSIAKQTHLPPGTAIILLAVHDENNEVLQRVVNTHRQTLRKRRTAVTVHVIKYRVSAAKARNRLMRLAKGTHLLFIDDDDVANPRMVELFVRAARLTDADVLTGFSEDFVANLQEPQMLSLSLGAAVESMMLLHYAGKSNMMVRKRAILAVGGFTEDSIGSVDTPFVDWDLYNKLLGSGATMAVIPEPTFYYRTHSINSIYQDALSNPDLIFYAHHKRATSFCKINNVSPVACVGIAYVIQALARPNSITKA